MSTNGVATMPTREGQIAGPSAAARSSGRYAKRHLSFAGFRIAIENEGGTARPHGGDRESARAQHLVPFAYGFLKGTRGTDGEEIDCFIGGDENSPTAYVIDQNRADTGTFDEHKVMLGFHSRAEAESAYRAAYQDRASERLGDISEMSLEDLRGWLGKRSEKAMGGTEIEKAPHPGARSGGIYRPPKAPKAPKAPPKAPTGPKPPKAQKPPKAPKGPKGPKSPSKAPAKAPAKPPAGGGGATGQPRDPQGMWTGEKADTQVARENRDDELVARRTRQIRLSGNTVQKIVFSKARFKTDGDCKAWARDQGFDAARVVEDGARFLIDQRNPAEFQQGDFPTITLTDGVQAVIGRLAQPEMAGKGTETAAVPGTSTGFLPPNLQGAQPRRRKDASRDQPPHPRLEGFVYVSFAARYKAKGMSVQGVPTIELLVSGTKLDSQEYDYQGLHVAGEKVTEGLLEDMALQAQAGGVYLIPSHHETFRLGVSTDARIADGEDGEKELFVTFQLFPDNPQVPFLLSEIDRGYIPDCSVGLVVKRTVQYDTEVGGYVGFLTEGKFEHVALTRPGHAAYPDATFENIYLTDTMSEALKQLAADATMKLAERVGETVQITRKRAAPVLASNRPRGPVTAREKERTAMARKESEGRKDAENRKDAGTADMPQPSKLPEVSGDVKMPPAGTKTAATKEDEGESARKDDDAEARKDDDAEARKATKEDEGEDEARKEDESEDESRKEDESESEDEARKESEDARAKGRMKLMVDALDQIRDIKSLFKEAMDGGVQPGDIPGMFADIHDDLTVLEQLLGGGGKDEEAESEAGAPPPPPTKPPVPPDPGPPGVAKAVKEDEDEDEARKEDENEDEARKGGDQMIVKSSVQAAQIRLLRRRNKKLERDKNELDTRLERVEKTLKRFEAEPASGGPRRFNDKGGGPANGNATEIEDVVERLKALKDPRERERVSQLLVERALATAFAGGKDPDVEGQKALAELVALGAIPGGGKDSGAR